MSRNPEGRDQARDEAEGKKHLPATLGEAFELVTRHRLEGSPLLDDAEEVTQMRSGLVRPTACDDPSSIATTRSLPPRQTPGAELNSSTLQEDPFLEPISSEEVRQLRTPPIPQTGAAEEKPFPAPEIMRALISGAPKLQVQVNASSAERLDPGRMPAVFLPSFLEDSTDMDKLEEYTIIGKGITLRTEVVLPPPRCLLYTSPSPRDQRGSRMPSSA